MKKPYISAPSCMDSAKFDCLGRIERSSFFITTFGILLLGVLVNPADAQETSGVGGAITSGSGGQVGAAVGQATGAVGQQSKSSGEVSQGGAAAGQSSFSASDEVFSAALGHSITSDSNLFRRPDSAGTRSDTINSTSVSLRFDKPISQQRFQFEVTETFNRYNNSSYLDFNGTNYRGAWLWSPSTRWNITVSADRSKSLAPFEDNLLLGSSQRNVMVSENRGINVDGWISGGWYLVMGVSQAEQKSEQGVVNQPDQRTDNGSLGVRYVTAAGNSITATQRTAKGDYLNQSAVPNVTGTGFHENETSLATIWRLTEKSELQARVARLERSNNDVGQRDFSGPASELSYTWRATNKLSLNIAANQSKQALQDPSFSYSAVSGVSIAPTWQISEKVSTHLRLSRAESKYRGSGPVPATGPAREDTTNSAELGLGWAPLRNLTVNSSLQRQKRTSNQAGAEFDDNLASVNASWLFW